MPIQRKAQLLAKTETSEGSSSNPGSSDGVLVFEPGLSDSVEVQDRVPSGPTLSRDFAPIGRQTREITFRSDLRGSGDITIPVTEPEFGKFLKSCGYKLGTLQKLTCGDITGSGYQLGESLVQAGPLGLIVGIFQSGAPALRATLNGAILVVAQVTGGAFTPALSTGTVSGSTSTMTAAAAYEGVVYQPTSEKLTQVTTAAWTGGTPAAAGEVLRVESPSGTVVGAVQVITANGGFTDMNVTQLFGTIANGNTLRNAAGTGTTTINADPTMVRTPSLTIRHNLDGWRRDLLGARGDFTLEGESGSPMQFSWTFSGDLSPGLDALQIATGALGTIRPPRLLGAICAYGLDVQVHRLPTKRISLANGGTVNPNLDANRTGGATGSNVTDRDPAFTVTVDAVNGAFDWEKARADGTPIRVAIVLGTVPGNIMSLVAPICQVTEITPSDSDGVATMDVTLRPRRIFESGDDELYISQL